MLGIAGKSIPIRWELTDADRKGLEGIQSSASVKAQRVGCAQLLFDSSGPAIVSSYSKNKVAGVADVGSGNYQLNWKTSKRWAGHCIKFTLNVKGVAKRTASFRFVAKASQLAPLKKRLKGSKCLVVLKKECLVNR
jgi:hypothetical protein